MAVFFIAALGVTDFIVALAVLIMILAGDKPMQVVRDVLSHVPAIGPVIADIINSWLKDVTALFTEAWVHVIEPVGEFLWSISVGTWNIVYQIVDTQEHMYRWLINAYAHILANDLSVLDQAEKYTDAHIKALNIPANIDLSQLEAEIAAAGAAAAAGTAAAEALAHALADQVQSEAVTLFGQAEAAITQAEARADALAQALTDEVQSEAVTLFGQLNGVIGTIEGQVQALPGQIEGTIPGIIDGIVPGIIAGAIPGILAQVLPRVTTLEGEVTRCLDPLCDTVTPQAPKLGQLGQFLNNLELLGIEAIILALAAEAVHDPEAVVHDFTDVVNAVGEPVMSGFRDLIGA